jgi:hypothetical protein
MSGYLDLGESNCLGVVHQYTDQTRSFSWLDASGQCTGLQQQTAYLTRRWWVRDRTRRWRCLRSTLPGLATGRDGLLIGRGFSASGQQWRRNREFLEKVSSNRTHPVTPDRTRLRVRSLSAFDFKIDCCHRPDASGQYEKCWVST